MALAVYEFYKEDVKKKAPLRPEPRGFLEIQPTVVFVCRGEFGLSHFLIPALNYFVYPYVEVDGKPFEKLDKQFSFEEVKSSE